MPDSRASPGASTGTHGLLRQQEPAMTDSISRTPNIPPRYPVKPVQPSSEDRRQYRKRKHSPKKQDDNEPDVKNVSDGDSEQPTIDEYI